MKDINVFLMVNFFCFTVIMCNMASAKDAMDSKEFVERASADSVAAVAAAKLALKKSTDSEVKELAGEIIADHMEMNKELSNIARKKELKISTHAEFVDRAKKLVLKQSKGRCFDDKYIDNKIILIP